MGTEGREGLGLGNGDWDEEWNGRMGMGATGHSLMGEGLWPLAVWRLGAGAGVPRSLLGRWWAGA
jgi:hypothetical protein